MSERAKYWSRQVAALEASGLSRAAFCRRRRLNYHTMTYWVKRLAGSPAVEGGGRHASFVEVSLPAMALSTPSMPPSAPAVAVSPPAMGRSVPNVATSVPAVVASTTYEVVLENGRSIRLGAAFDDGAVARLVRTLASC